VLFLWQWHHNHVWLPRHSSEVIDKPFEVPEWSPSYQPAPERFDRDVARDVRADAEQKKKQRETLVAHKREVEESLDASRRAARLKEQEEEDIRWQQLRADEENNTRAKSNKNMYVCMIE
jgi:hypothetical protein